MQPADQASSSAEAAMPAMPQLLVQRDSLSQ
jgi:hypothetical protein